MIHDIQKIHRADCNLFFGDGISPINHGEYLAVACERLFKGYDIREASLYLPVSCKIDNINYLSDVIGWPKIKINFISTLVHYSGEFSNCYDGEVIGSDRNKNILIIKSSCISYEKAINMSDSFQIISEHKNTIQFYSLTLASSDNKGIIRFIPSIDVDDIEINAKIKSVPSHVKGLIVAKDMDGELHYLKLVFPK